MKTSIRYTVILATMIYIAWVSVRFANAEYSMRQLSPVAVTLCLLLLFALSQIHRDAAGLSVAMATFVVIAMGLVGIYMLDRELLQAVGLIMLGLVLGFLSGLDSDLLNWLRLRYARSMASPSPQKSVYAVATDDPELMQDFVE